MALISFRAYTPLGQVVETGDVTGPAIEFDAGGNFVARLVLYAGPDEIVVKEIPVNSTGQISAAAQ